VNPPVDAPISSAVALGAEHDVGGAVDHRPGLGLGLAADQDVAGHDQRPRALAARHQAAVEQQLVESFARHASDMTTGGRAI
jgi:hypothetical protein